jgi:biopolymer transport protein ExbB
MELLHRSYEYLLQGGWIMIPLSLCSFVMWVLIFERLYTFRVLQTNDITSEIAIKIVNGGDVELFSRGLKTQLVKSFLARRTGVARIDRDLLRQVVEQLRRSLDKFLSAIATLAAVAPILGLLGTVLGMIQTFDVISVFGTGNAKAMAGGISVALVTTQTGLLVAIPGLFLSGMLSRRARQLTTRLQETAEILDRAIREMEPQGGMSR